MNAGRIALHEPDLHCEAFVLDPSPALADLSRLLSEGSWTYPLRTSPDGPVTGVRERGEVTETIVINSERDTTVARMLTEDLARHGQGRPRWLLWYFTGTLGDAVAELRELPEHGHPRAPRIRIPVPSHLWTPDTPP